LLSAENSVVKSLLQHNVRVLAMKLQYPFTTSSHVKRDSVSNSIKNADDRTRVFLFEAAPGYGKSLCLSQFIQQKIQAFESVAWVTLDPKENEAKRLITYICSALNSSTASLGLKALNLIEQGESSETIFHLLMDEIKTFAAPVHLALDDIHHLTSADSVSLLNDLVLYAPKNLTLYMTTRFKPLISLAKLTVEQVVKVFSESDLCFNLSDTRDWLSRNIEMALSETQVEKFHLMSLGWPTGLELLKNIYLNVNHINLQGDESILTDYIAQEWLPNLSETEIRLCGNLALLGRANSHYLNAVFSLTGTAEALKDLAGKHLFILKDQEKNSWYFIHPMFKACLLQNLTTLDKKNVFNLACDWLHGQGLNVAAVDMALKSDDKLRASELLELGAERILEQQDIAQLLHWKKKLPDIVITTSPRLIIIFSWTLALSQQLDEAERLIAQMDRLLYLDKRAVNNEVSGQLFAIRAYIARGRGNIDNVISLCRQAIDKLPAKSFMPQAMTYFTLSNAYITLNNVGLARDNNKLLFEIARSAGSIHLEMLALHEQARIEHVKGHLNMALKLLDIGLSLSDKQPHKENVAAYGRLLIYKGYICWLQHDTEKAEVLIRQGMKISERCHDSYIIMAYVLLSNIARQRHQIEQSFDELANGEALLQRWSVPAQLFKPWLTTMRANLLIDEGKVDSAIVSLKKLYSQLENNPYALSLEHYPALKGLVDVIYVRAQSMSGNHREALLSLDKKIESSQVSQQGFALIIVHIMRALLRFQLGKEEGALQDFRKALSMAEPENNIMPFIEYSAGMTALYGQLPEEIKSSPFVAKILQRIEVTQLDHSFEKTRAVLSQRELGVLMLIAQGMSNQDIAEKLFISLHTVKTHARRINAKLVVKSRTQAIIKAKETGLI
jgi:LuxR family maltose regulon positive regulatory protein